MTALPTTKTVTEAPTTTQVAVGTPTDVAALGTTQSSATTIAVSSTPTTTQDQEFSSTQPQSANGTVTSRPPAEPALSLEFHLEQDFDEDLKNPSSETFKTLAENITKQLDKIYFRKYGKRFNRTKVNSFRKGSIVVDSSLVFNNFSVIPKTSDVTQTLKEATSSNTSGFSLPVNISTIATTMSSTPTTTQDQEFSSTQPQSANGTVTSRPPAEPALSLEFHLEQDFDEDLKNPSSENFKTLAENITKQLDKIYFRKYGKRFIRTKVNSFRKGSIVVDSSLVFNNFSVIPKTSDVTQTLKEATSSNTSGFSLKVNISTIATTIPKQTPPTTTRTPTTQSDKGTFTLPESLHTGKTTTVPMEMISTLQTDTQTANPSPTPLKRINQKTTKVTTAAANLEIRAILLRFSLRDEFTSHLLDQHSDKYQQLQKTIMTEMNKIFSKEFPKSFFGSIVKGFRNGSVVTDVDLQFKEEVSQDELVSASQVKTILLNAAQDDSSFPLNIIPTSIRAFEKTLVLVNLSLVLSFSSSLDDSMSSFYIETSNALYQWLGAAFSKYYGTESVSSTVKFRNIDGWVGVIVAFEFNVEQRTPDDVLTAAVLSSSSPYLYLKHLLSVNGFHAPVDFFPLSLRITSLSFVADLTDRGSKLFLLYSTLIRTSVIKLYEDKKGFCDVYVTKMTSGSVVARMAVIFEKRSGISSSSVSQVLETGLPQLELNGLTVDPTSFQNASRPLTPPRPFPGYAVAIIVMCGLIIILLLVVVVVGCKTGMWEKLKRSLYSRSQHYDISAVHNGV
ncbi:hypothetical protein SKAU_G00039200 [Synaphobranchus kaupii]|uniref:SEA domain-containing protein n=1 Tax=Synaphobranchus kaupii TaxID=118154 RepID=A0A9Q1JHG4_SYNKA|nr:hypothetical protein SKAU_G00039200 [Synaphobranchus kaupii]